MANNSVKLTQKPSVSSANNQDQLVIVTNPSANNAAVNLIDVSLLFSNLTIQLGVQSTPANSTINVNSGTMFFDENYLYVAVSENVLKRVSLSSF